MRYLIIQKVGDRGTTHWSVHDYSNCLPANPMSDRGQLLIEVDDDSSDNRRYAETPSKKK